MISSYVSLYTLRSGCMGHIIHWFIIPLPRRGYRCQTLLGTGNENMNNNPWPPGAHSLVREIPNYGNVTSTPKLHYTLPRGSRGGRLELSELCVKGNGVFIEWDNLGKGWRQTQQVKRPQDRKSTPPFCVLSFESLYLPATSSSLHLPLEILPIL